MSCDIKCDNCEIRKNVARMFDLHWTWYGGDSKRQSSNG